MRSAVLKISDGTRRFCDERPADYGMENSLARKYRRAHPHKTAEAAAADLDLTPGEGRGVALGTASKTTLNKAFKAGHWPLVIEVFGDLLGQSLHEFLDEQERKHAEAERKAADDRRHMLRLAARLPDLLDLGNSGNL